MITISQLWLTHLWHLKEWWVRQHLNQQRHRAMYIKVVMMFFAPRTIVEARIEKSKVITLLCFYWTSHLQAQTNQLYKTLLSHHFVSLFLINRIKQTPLSTLYFNSLSSLKRSCFCNSFIFYILSLRAVKSCGPWRHNQNGKYSNLHHHRGALA